MLKHVEAKYVNCNDELTQIDGLTDFWLQVINIAVNLHTPNICQ